MGRQIQIAIDCADPERLARFWTDALDYEVEKPPLGFQTWAEFSEAEVPGERWMRLVDPADAGPKVLFHRVPEEKIVKNRVHLDIRVPGTLSERRVLVDAEVTRLVGAGATHVRTRDDDGDLYAVMQDPEGNEFCIG